MRRVLVLLAVGGFGAWLVGPALSARPYIPSAVEFDQPIAVAQPQPQRRGSRARGEAATARAAPSTRGGGWSSGPIRTRERFDLVGLSWHGSRGIGARIRVRDAASGRWRRWTALDADGGASGATEPVWAGGADALQVRLTGLPRDLRAHFVNASGTATAPRRLLTALRSGAHDAYVALAGAPARAQEPGDAPPIVTREEWGAEQCGPPRFAPVYGTVQAAFVHHTVNANDYGPQDSAALVRAICRYHLHTKRWRDIGYNFLVDRYGQIFEGRQGGIDQAVVGAQAQGYNGESTGVAEIGTYGAVAQTPAAIRATAELLAWKLSLHGVPVQGQVTLLSRGGPTNRYRAGTPVTFERISGHRDADNTDCPGNALYAQLPQIRALAAQLAPDLGAPATPAGVTVTLAAADATLDYPQPAQLAGRAAGPGGAPLAGATISIQIAGSSGGYVTLGRVLSAADGSWSLQLATQYSRRLRAAVRLPDGTLATSDPADVTVAPLIDVSQAPRRAVATRAFTVRGTIRPLRGGVTVAIARQGSDGAFDTIARLPARSSYGALTARVRLRRPAVYRLRLESRADARNGAGRSRDVILRAVR